MTSNAHRQVDSVAFKKLSFKFGGYKARYAWVSQRGYYPEDLDKANQDTHVEIEDFGADIGIDDCHLFAVFDGHGGTGDMCGIFCRDKFPPAFKAALKVPARPPAERGVTAHRHGLSRRVPSQPWGSG